MGSTDAELDKTGYKVFSTFLLTVTKMRAFLLAAILCSLVSASVLPRNVSQDYSDEVAASNLPESGQIVADPLAVHASVDPWKDSVLSLHNRNRAKYGAGPLTWSNDLYPGTLQWARRCVFQHSSGGGHYGENLAAGTGSYGFPNAIDSWMKESAKYDYNHPGFSSETGHFTQVVWKSTRRVACAIANCGPGTIFSQASKYVVCRYDPPGNWQGRFPQNVGRPV